MLPFVMMHVAGPQPCGERAAYMVESPAFGATIQSSQFRRLDGTTFAVASIPMCGSCGGHFRPVREGIYTNEAEPKRVPVPHG